MRPNPSASLECSQQGALGTRGQAAGPELRGPSGPRSPAQGPGGRGRAGGCGWGWGPGLCPLSLPLSRQSHRPKPDPIGEPGSQRGAGSPSGVL